MLQTGENNKKLRTKSKEVKEITSNIKQIINEMAEFMEEEEWVWISACQIWYNIQISIITIWEIKKWKEIYKGDEIIINPKIIHESKETHIDEEWCLSLPNIFWKVKRNNRIVIKYTNTHWKKITKKFFNLTARIVQHEIDHLNWILFTDKTVGEK